MGMFGEEVVVDSSKDAFQKVFDVDVGGAPDVTDIGEGNAPVDPTADMTAGAAKGGLSTAIYILIGLGGLAVAIIIIIALIWKCRKSSNSIKILPSDSFGEDQVRILQNFIDKCCKDDYEYNPSDLQGIDVGAFEFNGGFKVNNVQIDFGDPADAHVAIQLLIGNLQDNTCSDKAGKIENFRARVKSQANPNHNDNLSQIPLKPAGAKQNTTVNFNPKPDSEDTTVEEKPLSERIQISEHYGEAIKMTTLLYLMNSLKRGRARRVAFQGYSNCFKFTSDCINVVCAGHSKRVDNSVTKETKENIAAALNEFLESINADALFEDVTGKLKKCINTIDNLGRKEQNKDENDDIDQIIELAEADQTTVEKQNPHKGFGS